MIPPKCFTTIKTKEEHIEKFFDLIRDQTIYGGKKYSASSTREFTDVIVEQVGCEWVLGTMMKYIGRFKNLQRERDLLKIATYAFILWLQMGYHLEEKSDTDTWNEKKKKLSPREQMEWHAKEIERLKELEG